MPDTQKPVDSFKFKVDDEPFAYDLRSETKPEKVPAIAEDNVIYVVK